MSGRGGRGGGRGGTKRKADEDDEYAPRGAPPSELKKSFTVFAMNKSGPRRPDSQWISHLAENAAVAQIAKSATAAFDSLPVGAISANSFTRRIV